MLYTRTKRSLGIPTGPSQRSESDEIVAGRTEAYISNRRLLLSLADAGGRLMYAYKDLLELAGLTTRLYTLLATLHNLPQVEGGETSINGVELKCIDVGIPSSGVPAQEEAGSDTDSESGRVQTTLLVKDLSLMLVEGEHLMITGSNGVGKTSVARVLAGLWAPDGPLAQVKRPADTPDGRKGLFVVPQRAYMVTGSLIDQMIYPHSYADFLESGKTMEDMMKILEMVYLAYLPEREGGWFTRKEWRDVLSGGEKQRVGLTQSRNEFSC